MKVDLDYLLSDPDRHRNPRLYVRRYGRRIRIREKPGTPEFLKAYHAALAELSARSPSLPPAVTRPAPFPPRSLGWLAAQYFASDEFQGLDLKSQATRRGVIEACLKEPHRDDDPDLMGMCPLTHVTAVKVKRLCDLKRGTPGAANNRKKYLSAMFAWAINDAKPALMSVNPARDVKRAKYATDGFHTWTTEEVRKFEERHPVGTKARLALALLMYTGVRRSDLVTLGRQHVKDGWLRFVPQKTRYKRVRLSEKPLLPELSRIIDASPCGDLTFLVTEYGQAFTANGFGGWFRDKCNQAGLPHCSAHGLRKAAATLAAEKGATINQLMAIFDWDTPAQAKVYTDAADRKKLSGEAMELLASGRTENTECRTENSGSVAP